MQNTNPAPSPDFKRCTGSKKRALSWPRYACLGSCPCATSCPQEPERSPSTVSPAPAGFAGQQTSSPLLSGIQLINSPFLRAGICTLQLQSPSRLASQKTHVFYRKKKNLFEVWVRFREQLEPNLSSIYPFSWSQFYRRGGSGAWGWSAQPVQTLPELCRVRTQGEWGRSSPPAAGVGTTRLIHF